MDGEMTSRSPSSARIALAGLIAVIALAMLAPGASAATVLVLAEPAAGATTGPAPSFSGTSTDLLDPVTLAVYHGSGTGGTPLPTVELQPNVLSGEWSGQLGESLSGGTYTAQAEQSGLLGGLGEEPASSEPVTFTVDASPPEVTIGQPLTPSKVRTPAFAGHASEATQVVVHVMQGASEVASASTVAASGVWSTVPLSTALPTGKHTYTAYATAQSGLGNQPGESKPVSFVVDTESPTVTIEQPPTPTGNTTPSFSGTASEDTEVVVHVIESGVEVAKASTTAAGGSWSTSALSKALAKGQHTYTAYATEVSSLGNPDGKSGEVSFEVDTEAPKLSITGPPALSGDTTPSFSGTTNEDGEVVVHILEGSKQVAVTSAQSSGGGWSATSPALGTGDHKFSAYATEVSPVSGAEGQSSNVEFEVDTESPVVTLTPPPARTGTTSPSFRGEASEETEVVVHIFEGSTEVAKASTTAAGGKWSTSTLSKALPTGRHSFTVSATEVSGLGNAQGKTSPDAFEVDTEPPTVVIQSAPAHLSGDTTPSFSGTASEETEVTIHVFEGSTEVGKQSTTASGGKWAITLSKALASGKHSFTAYATEKSALENADGQSSAVSFDVDTEPPTVLIQSAPPGLSGDTTPSFSGTASEETEVTIHVFEGSTEVGKQSTTASGGKWAITLSKALASGKHSFTAYATEKSGLGNADGKSESVPFVVSTEVPVVTIVRPARSNHTTPSFSGSASEATEVTVHVFEGSTEVATSNTTASGGKWSTSTLSKALPTGKHSFTVYATEKSGLGNGEGQSETTEFEVDTEPPTVLIQSAPAHLSGDTTPSFSGTASEETEVTIHVFEGSTEVGKQSTTASSGKWSITLSTPLASGNHSFTAYASEKSGIENGDGKSPTVGFEVSTVPPTVTIVGPPARSNNPTPSFSGTASEETEVTVHVFSGSTEVAKASTKASAGEWTTSTLSKALAEGKFTAYATEKSGLGNGEGTSSPVSFEVISGAPSVTITGPPLASNDTTPSFSGTASEETEVTVHVFEGSTEVGKQITTASGGRWAATLGKPLSEGKHSFSAYATEKSGLGNSDGKSATVSFEVNTNPPVVSIVVGPKALSNNTSPSFSGSASEATEVTVHVFEGSTEVDSGSTMASSGKWSAALSKALPTGKHSFSAYATEKSGLGNADGKSEPVSFEVNTNPPVVSIVVGPKALSNNTSPSFSGSASEATEVTVHVFEGSTEVDSGSTMASSGKWSAALSKALPTGKHSFSAYATEKSGLGNADGKSEPVSFEVNTEPPVVTIVGPKAASNNTTPLFSGSASEETEVTVHVFEGSTEVAKQSTTASAGKWSITLSKALQSGKHSFAAEATEKSGLGNPDGRSKEKVSFEVNTGAPVVTIVGPKTPSKNTSPGFSGTASEATEVTVHVFEGSTEVDNGSTTASSGSWSASLNKALATGKHKFTAYATEKSGLGNAEGRSETVEFEVNTEPPTVTISQPTTPSKNLSPSFSGSASEDTEVTVHVLEGSTEVDSGTATASSGTWTAMLSKPLPEGKHSYTAYATEKSGLGNSDGRSKESVSFEVTTLPPTVELESPPPVSNRKTPAFSGSASESLPVTVEVFAGTAAEGKAVAKVVAAVSAGHFKSSEITTELSDGKYTALATEQSSIGNEAGHSKAVTFEVNTGTPLVEVTQPSSPSANTEPSFSGTVSGPAGETVTVYVHEGPQTGKIIRELSATLSKGTWKTGVVTPALPTGRHVFTVEASAPSSIGNGTGISSSREFVVLTEAPVVSLDQPTTPSRNATPSFHGSASETTPVEVTIYAGAAATGTPVETVSASGTGAGWESAALGKPGLADGEYTAIAEQKSAIGNGSGTSAPMTFTIDTKPPAVTLDGLPSPSSNRKPDFSGTATDSGPVTVDIFAGTGVSGEPLLEVQAEISEGKWNSGPLENALKLGQYTAVATQKSSLGNESGVSEAKPFAVEEIPPGVQTEGSNGISRTYATLYGSVNPVGGSISSCDIEVGTTTAYGRSLGCAIVSGASAFPAEATGFVPVFIRIYTLTPGTVYHYRVVATGEGGTAAGADNTFTTLPPLPKPVTPPPTPKAGLGASEVKAFFAEELGPHGKAARIGAILKKGLYSQAFKGPEAGTATIGWYYQPPKPKHGKKPKAVLLASGQVTFSAAGSKTLTIRLTKAGRTELKHSKRLAISVKCSFKAVGGTPVVALGAFRLTR